ncbi:Uncharacterized protein MCB1EB_0600 [Mycoavidus cysteinexigens]|uniref:Uncharacterized protein n=1 Tax=Mycoavidus cysteinexigens TaxID=1553431 RepID=A0A2Z6ETN1_9BURK|nr:hypothetical protein [Mycoavidus cysteinexigens]BBE08761.1 Uncharacterized protein MCB1EB_0600 [Mycoavidus cysteinexigens]GLR01583.1 hypothetical protein GCM10007934_13950 [Mycoavidus cysteinexigens]
MAYPISEDTIASEFNLLEIAESPGLDPSKQEAHRLSKFAYWLPQGGYVDIKIRPNKNIANDPCYLFTPDFSHCSLIVHKKNVNDYRVRHVEGGKEDEPYHDLPEHIAP